MKKAGLRHGAFHVHFRSRDELVAEAVLTSHDHFDHLDLASVRHLVAQLFRDIRSRVGETLTGGAWLELAHHP
jgi:L-ascorbate metabolism protein UlaG (beta-lactamase superfamily)